uniref:Uncharacterized protein n=1 Tax=Anguilla anguilla TaxID=7936 RepID=A0A0E9R2Q3_ANGAN
MAIGGAICKILMCIVFISPNCIKFN